MLTMDLVCISKFQINFEAYDGSQRFGISYDETTCCKFLTESHVLNFLVRAWAETYPGVLFVYVLILSFSLFHIYLTLPAGRGCGTAGEHSACN